MGTFLKIIGIIALVFGILVVVFSLLGFGHFINFISPQDITSESNTMMPWVNFTMAGNIGGAIGGLGIIVGGSALFCLGSIYNNIIEMKIRQ